MGLLYVGVGHCLFIGFPAYTVLTNMRGANNLSLGSLHSKASALSRRISKNCQAFCSSSCSLYSFFIHVPKSPFRGCHAGTVLNLETGPNILVNPTVESSPSFCRKSSSQPLKPRIIPRSIRKLSSIHASPHKNKADLANASSKKAQ